MFEKLTKALRKQDKPTAVATDPASNPQQDKLKQEGDFHPYVVEGAFYIFAIMAIPLAGIFWSGSYGLKVMYVLYCLFVITLAILTMIKFVFVVSEAANKSGKYPAGLLVAKGVFGLTIPLLLIRIVGALMMEVMPKYHGGIICDLLNTIRTIYWSTEFPRLMNILFIGSIAILTFIFLRAIDPSNRKD